MAQLNHELADAVGTGFQNFAQTAVEILHGEVGGGVVVVLLDLPGEDSPVVAFAHQNAARRAKFAALLGSMGADLITDWVNDFGRDSIRVRGRLTDAEAEGTSYGQLLRGHADEVGIDSAVYVPLRHPDGRVRGLLTCTRESGLPDFAPADLDVIVNATNTTSLLVDVAISRAAERAVNRYWSTAFEDAPIGKIVLDADRRYVRMNPKASEILGVTSWSMLGRQWPAISDDEDLDEDLSDLEQASLGLPVPYRIRQIHPPDRAATCWIQRSISAAFDQRGEVELFHVQFADVTRLHEVEAHAKELAEQRRVLLTELISAEQAERTRIGHDVHDDSIQLLAAAQLRMQLLNNQLGKGDPASRAAEVVSELLTTAQRRLRQLLFDLEPPSTANRPLHEALQQIAEAFFEDSGTTVSVVPGWLSEPPEEIAAVCYRAVRESLRNARQHATAASVLIELGEESTVWQIRVVDDGVGIPEVRESRPDHLGLRGMHSRIEAVGGTCAVSRRPEGGTEVRLVVPKPA
ncbi:MAG TPA: PAS domain-containing protein [Jatrophihabitans sp.]|jgi:PAS domain S-box-containing protein